VLHHLQWLFILCCVLTRSDVSTQTIPQASAVKSRPNDLFLRRISPIVNLCDEETKDKELINAFLRQ
jgi:hypothetical protein